MSAGLNRAPDLHLGCKSRALGDRFANEVQGAEVNLRYQAVVKKNSIHFMLETTVIIVILLYECEE